METILFLAHTEADVASKRPGTGVAPSDKHLVLGKRLTRALDADALILPRDLA